MENFELSDCIYEHITQSFYYGLFGDFKLVIDTKTGYFNATKLCIEGGKHFRQWKVLEKSKRMIKFFDSRRQNSDAYEVDGYNKNNIEKQITGTYVPKELILDIASWISIEFYDKCNKVIINYFVNEFKKMDQTDLQNKIKEVEERLTLEYEEVIKVKDDKIDELMNMMRSLGISLEEVKDQNDELLNRNKGLEKNVKKVQRKLGIAVEDRAPLPEQESKRERFVLLKLNDDEYYPYYTIRAQNDYTKRKLKTKLKHFPNLEVLLDFKCSPNSKTLYTRIKENLKTKNVIFKGNNIDLEESEITEEELVEEMTTINDSRKNV